MSGHDIALFCFFNPFICTFLCNTDVIISFSFFGTEMTDILVFWSVHKMKMDQKDKLLIIKKTNLHTVTHTHRVPQIEYDNVTGRSDWPTVAPVHTVFTFFVNFFFVFLSFFFFGHMVHRLHELLHWTADWLDACCCCCCCSESLMLGPVPYRNSLHLCKVRSFPSWPCQRSIFRS